MSAQDRLKKPATNSKAIGKCLFYMGKEECTCGRSEKSKTANGLTYSINQETYLKDVSGRWRSANG